MVDNHLKEKAEGISSHNVLTANHLNGCRPTSAVTMPQPQSKLGISSQKMKFVKDSTKIEEFLIVIFYLIKNLKKAERGRQFQEEADADQKFSKYMVTTTMYEPWSDAKEVEYL